MCVSRLRLWLSGRLPRRWLGFARSAVCEMFDVRVEIYSDLSPRPLDSIKVTTAEGRAVRRSARVWACGTKR